MDSKKVFLIRNVAPEKFGGGEVYQLELASKLRKAGFCPFILTNSKELTKKAKEEGFFVLMPPYIKNQNWSGIKNLLLPVYFCRLMMLKKWYMNIFRRYMPDVVNIQSRDDFLAATFAAKKYGIRILWTDHADFRNWVLWNVNKKFKNIIGKKIIKASMYTYGVIFVSKRVRAETNKLIFPWKVKNAITIENGVRDRLGVYRDVKMKRQSFVYVGRIIEEKGVRDLIEAFGVVSKKFRDIRLNIYGSGEDLEKYKRLAKDADEKIIFHGQTDKPLKALAENEVFVLPSYKEGLSLSLLDAAMMGKTIIATDVDGSPEVVRDEETGLLVPPKNVIALAEAMERVLGDKKLADNLGRAARKYYKENFDFDKIFDEKMLSLYNVEKE